MRQTAHRRWWDPENLVHVFPPPAFYRLDDIDPTRLRTCNIFSHVNYDDYYFALSLALFIGARHKRGEDGRIEIYAVMICEVGILAMTRAQVSGGFILKIIIRQHNF